MARIAGIDLEQNRLVDYSLTRIYGIGRSNVYDVLKKADVAPTKRVHTLTDEEIARIQKAIDSSVTVEGDLRRQVNDNIKRLRTIGAYRGVRHARGLPSRGQRTRSNARTKRGKRRTVGAMKKDDRAKVE